MRAVLFLANAQQANAALTALWRELKPWLIAGHRFEVDVRPERRSTEQNSKLWAMLGEVSKQVEWYGQRLTPEEFKHVFSAALKKQRVVPGIDGGFVVLGQSTSRMSKAELSEMIELVYAFGAERGVQFKETHEADAPATA
jgi:hypothetical protein